MSGRPVRVLVVVASRHGSTAEIGTALARAIGGCDAGQAAGLEAVGVGAIRGSVVAVDSYDVDARTGWGVTVSGPSRVVPQPGLVVELPCGPSALRRTDSAPSSCGWDSCAGSD